MTTYHVVTSGDVLMLRAGRGTNQTILARMPKGTNVELIDQTPVNNWYHIRVTLNGETKEGFAFGDYLKPRALADVTEGLTSGTLGMNIPKLAFYGTPGAPNGITSKIWDDQKKCLNALNVKALRIFVSHRAVSDSLARVNDLLASLGNTKVVLCLIDVFSESGCVLAKDADEGFYDMHTDAGNKLHPRYFTDGIYAAPGGYHDYVRQAVSTLSQHKNILYWELGNELTANIFKTPTTKAQGKAFLDFALSTIAVIRKADNLAMVSTGLVNSTHVAPNDGSISREDYTFQLYQLFDAVSLHYYREDGAENDIDIDLKVAHKLGLPVYIGELGADPAKGNRADYFRAQIKAAKNDRGVFMVMPWDFGSRQSQGFGGDCGIAWRQPDINDVLGALSDSDLSECKI
jgi:hypothetical protein